MMEYTLQVRYTDSLNVSEFLGVCLGGGGWRLSFDDLRILGCGDCLLGYDKATDRLVFVDDICDYVEYYFVIEDL